MAVLPPKVRSAVLWTMKAVLAAIFLWAGVAKLAGNARMVHEFDVLGGGQWFRVLTGGLEVVGAVLLLIPRSSFYAALPLLGICAGAFVAQLAILHNGVVHTVVMGAMLAAIAWDARPSWLLRAG
jgi:putative oxidoreductase